MSFSKASSTRAVLRRFAKARLLPVEQLTCVCMHGRHYATEAALDMTPEHPQVLPHIRTPIQVEKPSTKGQPTSSSHPHLVQSNEITPGLSQAEYDRRRRQFVQSLPENSLAVLVAGTIKYMSGEIFYKFRQASDFWYLTGCQEPDSAVILERSSSSRGYIMTLFCRKKDSEREKWDGARTGPQEARHLFSADDVQPIDQLGLHLKSLSDLYKRIYVDPATWNLVRTKGQASKPPSFLNRYTSRPSVSRSQNESWSSVVLENVNLRNVKPVMPFLSKLRAIKSPEEQRLMRAAADISGTAHAKTMRFTKPGMMESAAAAHFEYICSLQGAQRPAYVPVVASGANALVIHYTTNDHLIQKDELVLIDAGCEYNGYASDITRTFPASGKFSSPQYDLYSAVLSAQKALISLCTSSNQHSLDYLHRHSCKLLQTELQQIGFDLRTGDIERILYPHYLSHPIGIDLHESTDFSRSSTLESGMVITIEPGIYVPPSPAFPKYFHNMGIRIEDEVLVQEDHPIVLSVNAPKEIVDVEGACQGSLGLSAY